MIKYFELIALQKFKASPTQKYTNYYNNIKF